MEPPSESSSADTSATPSSSDQTPRRAKRRRVSSGSSSLHGNENKSQDHKRPVHNPDRDAKFLERVVEELQKVAKRKRPSTRSARRPTQWGPVNAKRMLKLRQNAKPPARDEVCYVTCEEAEKLLEPGKFFDGPIVTRNTQQFKWSPLEVDGTPIQQFLNRWVPDLDWKVSVQDSILEKGGTKSSSEEWELRELLEYYNKEVSRHGYRSLNVLDMRNTLPDSISLNFLNGFDTQMLPQVRNQIAAGPSRSLSTGPWHGWGNYREAEKWTLLCFGPAQTLEHEDPLAPDTYLALQKGELGIGWVSRAGEEEVAAFSENPQESDALFPKIRYLRLEAGQTVYFPAGTIHFVFRAKDARTLITGGHVMRWSRIQEWMANTLNQVRHPNIASDAVLPHAEHYVTAVASLVQSREREGRVDEIGGREAIAAFWRLKEEFDELIQESNGDETKKEEEEEE
ncbi:hypothetical protein BDV96DRAFT_655370 [Lophiotrema nucula]|uniref:JmjC domain-containing protein n=1 Tax=Lophiotrema nucula TaxID=690887 RepID=A0A6A5YHT0_9PLEO|nr:hypothetical protein BDV96DRAFT_655370 [Lophiotrema nucula]